MNNLLLSSKCFIFHDVLKNLLPTCTKMHVCQVMNEAIIDLIKSIVYKRDFIRLMSKSFQRMDFSTIDSSLMITLNTSYTLFLLSLSNGINYMCIGVD